MVIKRHTLKLLQRFERRAMAKNTYDEGMQGEGGRGRLPTL